MGKRTVIILLAVLLLCMACGCGKQKEHLIWSGGDAPARTDGQEDIVQPTEPEPTEEETLRDDGLEYAIFPMEYLSITQTSGEGTHLCNWAVDLAGQDTGIDEFYAPFTLRIVRIQSGYNIVWAQSVDKVHLANGGLDYVTVLLEHSNNIDGLYVGQVIPQGQVFYTEGTAGNAVGNHVHCEFGLGEYVDEGSYHADDGRVAINNGIAANEILFLTRSTLYVSNGDGGFSWNMLDADTEQIVSGGWHCQGKGHQADQIVTVAEPTCTSSGSVEYTCTLCGQKVTEEIPPTGHEAVETRRIEPSADACGAVLYSCSTCGSEWLELLWQQTPECAFSDVASDDPAAASIADVCRRGLMDGADEETFFPDGYLSRVELLSILHALSGDNGWYDCDYSDVASDDPDRTVIGWATANGLAGATSEKKFTPEVAVTREDAIAMVMGYLRLTGQSCSLVDASDAAAWAVSSGLYAPTDNLHCVVTRAEGARLLALMLHLPELG